MQSDLEFLLFAGADLAMCFTRARQAKAVCLVVVPERREASLPINKLSLAYLWLCLLSRTQGWEEGTAPGSHYALILQLQVLPK